MQYTHAYRHTYMQTYKIYAYTCNIYLHACMHADTQIFMPLHALCICMHGDTPLYLFGHTHMQCHAHNILFSVIMCNIYFLILIQGVQECSIPKNLKF